MPKIDFKRIDLERDRDYEFTPKTIYFHWDNDVAWIKKDELEKFIQDACEYYGLATTLADTSK